MPKRWCQCTGCPACTSPGRRPGAHNILFDADSTGALKCAGCFTEYRKRRNTDAPGRPSPTERGYGAEWRRISAEVIATATTCHWCGGEFTPDNPATCDHVIPKARGGTNDRSNLVPACRRCNSRRGGEMRKRKSQR